MIYTTIKIFKIEVFAVSESEGVMQCRYHTKQWVSYQDYFKNSNDC